ncbi:hypothetical protein M670_00149 [Schinkia azotoformans MEV2011]|uniref:Uncharacterized protein n=1 Tax=Schinkia azotoformans MEV2011 TaxID=1348973 RepID=A0A072NTG8_SCHAZ|nr:hypothetical protein [Schinkia azotoformans]KEF40133.1 hypothetical protein M670_00149 [Schinkia azotoformans MEV2011]
MANFKIGNIVEDRMNGELLGRYLVAKLNLGSMIGNKFALISLTGTGVANGYHDSLEELEKAAFSGSMVVVKNYEEQLEENNQLKSTINVDRYEYGQLHERYKKIKEENEFLRNDLMIAKGEA